MMDLGFCSLVVAWYILIQVAAHRYPWRPWGDEPRP